MYVPKHFGEGDGEKLAALIDENGFGVLVTVSEGRPFASHIPFIYEREANVLLGHVARANPQWRHFSIGSEVMVVFQGPHAYVSPSWYRSPGVPTWNYAVAHVYGSAEALEEPSRIKGIIERLAGKYERNNKPPWVPTYDPRLLGAIVGIEVRIKEVQGKFKLSQNRSAADRAAVVAKLEATGSEGDLALARLMEKNKIA
ncbi:MAG: FMN-binding negative transcriptional regulator [Betaproteobacteria bacterium]|nr:FMN-binding negative transcriptional regulator [Betaproteobacteria bacterium]